MAMLRQMKGEGGEEEKKEEVEEEKEELVEEFEDPVTPGKLGLPPLRKNGKQCRPWSDYRSSLILVCTICLHEYL